jgi:nucleoside-diphosphate-sugar epimerase
VKDLLPTAKLLRVEGKDEIAAVVREVAPTAIVHTACSYGRKGETHLEIMETNLYLGAILLQALLDLKPQGEGVTTFINTSTGLTPEVSLYALSKAQFSAWGRALAFSSPHRLCFIDIQLQQMYGPGDDRSKFISHVIDACRNREPRLSLTEGEQLRDFIHIDDVVRAYDYILNRRDQFNVSEGIDVGSGDAITMRRFVELTKEVSGAQTVLDFGAVPYRANEAMLCVANTKRLRSLGWYPTVSLADGLRRLINAEQ